jgi:hypothetical protein
LLLKKKILDAALIYLSKNSIGTSILKSKKITENTSILDDKKIDIISNTDFSIDNYFTSVDILKRNDSDSWDLFSIKLSNKCKIKYIIDLSFSKMVLSKLKINITKIYIIRLSSDYRFRKNIVEFIEQYDYTKEINITTEKLSNDIMQIEKTVEASNAPKLKLNKNCKNCIAIERCIKKEKRKYTIFSIPNISTSNIEKLTELGITNIDKIPKDFKLSLYQKKIIECVLNNKIHYISENLKSELCNIKTPFYYLDFESITTTIPLYHNCTPHTRIITQFSIDKTDEKWKLLAHYEYIANHKINCSKKLVKKLINCLSNNQGSIITYSNFEFNSIIKFIEIFPNLRKELEKIISRIINLELIIKKNYYNINFLGKLSIKSILPIITNSDNNNDYKNCEINNGLEAAAAFSIIANNLCKIKEINKIKQQLLKYCAQDTIAMIKIHKFLTKIAS